MKRWPDQIDVNIIRLLRSDGRMPNTEIAQNLGISEGSIRRRIGRMISERLVRIVALTDPSILGYELEALVALEVSPVNVRDIAEKVAELPEVRYVGISTGPYDILISACFKSNGQLLDFLAGKIATLEGVKRIQTHIILDVAKHGYDWVPELNQPVD